MSGFTFCTFFLVPELDPDLASQATAAAVVLHNFLQAESCNQYIPPGYADAYADDGLRVDGQWRSEVQRNNKTGKKSHGKEPANKAVDIRDTFKNYFNGPGQIPWQR